MADGNFTFPCPHCGQRLEAEPDMVGIALDCPGCGNSIVIPSPPEAPSDAPPSEAIPPVAQAPVIQTLSKGEGGSEPPPIITVVKKREGFFARNRKWLIPVAGGTAALLLIIGLVAARPKSGKRQPKERERTTTSSTPGRPSYYVPPSAGFHGESREFVRNHIAKNNNCRLVSITKTGGDIVVCGDNDWAASGCSRAIMDTLQAITDENERIADVCLTESGRFIVLFGRNAAKWNDIPADMEVALRTYHANNEELYSASLNDAGDWIVVSSGHYACSATWLKQWLADGAMKFGILRAATVSTDAAVAVYDDGFKFFGNVPEDLKTALRDAEFDVQIIKIAGPAWFFASRYGYSYRYHM